MVPGYQPETPKSGEQIAEQINRITDKLIERHDSILPGSRDTQFYSHPEGVGEADIDHETNVLGPGHSISTGYRKNIQISREDDSSTITKQVWNPDISNPKLTVTTNPKGVEGSFVKNENKPEEDWVALNQDQIITAAAGILGETRGELAKSEKLQGGRRFAQEDRAHYDRLRAPLKERRASAKRAADAAKADDGIVEVLGS